MNLIFLNTKKVLVFTILFFVVREFSYSIEILKNNINKIRPIQKRSNYGALNIPQNL